MNSVMTGTFTYNEKDYNFNFVTNISTYDKLSFVNSVVVNVVDDDFYNSIIRDLIFDFEIINTFTNIDADFIINTKDENGNDINPIILIEHFLENSKAVEIVKANIEYLTGIHPNVISNSLSKLIDTFERKVSEVDLSGATEMINLLSGIKDDFTVENAVKAYINNTK